MSCGSSDKKIKKLCLVVIKKFLVFLVLCILLVLFNFVVYSEYISIIYVSGTFSKLFIFFINTSLINMFVASVCFSLYFLTILNRKLKSIVDIIMRSDNFGVNSSNELCNEINKLAIYYQRVVSFTKHINRMTEFQILLSTCSSFLNIISKIFFMYAYSIACFKKENIITIGTVFFSGIIYIMFHSIEMFAVANISYRAMKKVHKTGVILSKIIRADLNDKLDDSVRSLQSNYI